MWTTFWPDVIVAVIGAVLTVAIAFVTFLVQRRRNEKHALRGLINEIHRRRAFTPIPNPIEVPGAADHDDFKRVNSSVLDIRDRVRHAREQVRDDAKVQAHLSDMTRACNLYLERSYVEPSRYYFTLMDLRQSLSESIGGISRDRKLPALEPGTAAF